MLNSWLPSGGFGERPDFPLVVDDVNPTNFAGRVRDRIKKRSGMRWNQTARKMADSSVNRVTFERALQREQTRQKRYRQGGQHQELNERLQQHEEIPLMNIQT